MGVLADGGSYLLANTALQNFSFFRLQFIVSLRSLAMGFAWRLDLSGDCARLAQLQICSADLQRRLAVQICSAYLQRRLAAQICRFAAQICSADLQCCRRECVRQKKNCSADFGLDPHPQGQKPHLLQISSPFSEKSAVQDLFFAAQLFAFFGKICSTDFVFSQCKFPLGFALQIFGSCNANFAFLRRAGQATPNRHTQPMAPTRHEYHRNTPRKFQQKSQTSWDSWKIQQQEFS